MDAMSGDTRELSEYIVKLASVAANAIIEKGRMMDNATCLKKIILDAWITEWESAK